MRFQGGKKGVDALKKAIVDQSFVFVGFDFMFSFLLQSQQLCSVYLGGEYGPHEHYEVVFVWLG